MNPKTFVMVMAVLLLAACSRDSEVIDESPTTSLPMVFTVNYPLAWMAESLSGPLAEVVFPAPRDVDPAFWEPDVDTVIRYQSADLVLLNGAGYARWVPRVSLPGSALRDTSIGYADRLLQVESGPVHSHGPAGAHSHGEVAFTTWLDFELAQLQLQTVAVALSEILPDTMAIEIASREKEVTRLLADLDARMVKLGARLGGAPIIYSHPVYQYLDQRYNLNGRALHWEPDVMPDEDQWRKLASLLTSHPARLMLWEGEPLPEVVSRLASMGIDVVVFSPLGNRPAEGDFAAGMLENIRRLEEVLEAQAQGMG